MNGKPAKKASRKSVGSSDDSEGKKKVPAANPFAIEYMELLAAWRTEFGRAIEMMAKHVNNNSFDFEIPLDGPVFLNHIQNRLGLALEYVVLDADERALSWPPKFGH
jgi:hypothetical protein